MVISQKYADIAVDYTNENRKKKGVILDENYLERYKEKLRNFAKDYNIMENSDLDLGLWTQISLDITYLMMHTTNRVQTMDDEFIRNVKPNEYILAAFNYLIAVTAKELGSPKLPIETFRPFFKSWAQSILTAKPRTNISLDDTFNSQRRIDALDLRNDRIEPLLTEINNKNNLAENVTKLYAEYQALVRRQANHGFFWRLFHSAENDARTALINELRDTLQPYVPDIDLRSKTPTSPHLVAMSADEEATVRGINAGVSLDERDIPTVFGYDKERANNPLSNAQPQINSNNIIAQDSIISQADSNEFELVMEEYNDAIANEEENKEENKEEIKEEIEEDIKEEIEEENNEPVEIVKENPQPKILSATEQFNKINTYNLSSWIEDQMWSQIESIVDYSVNKYTALMGAATAIIGSSETLNKTYDQVKAAKNNPKVLKTLVHDTIPEIFYDVFKGFETCRLRPKDRLVAAQKMTDIVLNKLTVVGFNGAEYSEFAKNYTISNDVGLYDFLAKNYPGISREGIRDIVDAAREELGVDPLAISIPNIINDVPADEVIKELDNEEEQLKENNDVIKEEEQPFVNEPAVEEPIVEQSVANEPIVIEPEKKEENEIKIDVAIDDESNNLAVARDILLEILEKSHQARMEEEARIKAQEEKLKKFAEIAERIAKRGAMSKIEDEALRKSKEEEAKRKAEEEEARIKAEVEAQIKAEEEQRQKQASVNGFIDDLFVNASADVEREQRELEEARKKAEEEEARRKEEEEAKRIAEEEEAKRKLEEEAKRKAEEEEAQRKAEEEAKRKAEEEEAQRKAEEEAKRIAEENAENAFKAEEDRKLKLAQDVAKAIAENPYTHINDELIKKCEEAVSSKEVAQEAELDIGTIFGKGGGLFIDGYERNRMDFMKYAVANIPRNILNDYKEAAKEGKNIASREVVMGLSRKIFGNIFKWAEKSAYSIHDRIYMAQDITDVFMRKYSPAAFIPEVFDDLADYYVIANRIVLTSELDKQGIRLNKDRFNEVVEYGEKEKKGTGKIDAFRARRTERTTAKANTLKELSEKGANVADNAYIEDYEINAYATQFQYGINDRAMLRDAKRETLKVFNQLDENIAERENDLFFANMNYNLPKVYNNMKHYANCDATFGDVMTYMSKEVFNIAYDYTSKYDLNKECRLALTQKLADVILTNFSPVKYNKACKPAYANNFVIGSADNLMELADNATLSEDEAIELMEDAISTSNNFAKRMKEERERKAEEEEERRAAEEEAQRKAEEEAKRNAEEEAKRKAEEEEAQRRAEEEAKRKAEEEAKRKADEEEAKRKAEEEAKKKAEEDAKTNPAEEEAKKKADEIEARWAIENKQLSEKRKQILEQKKVADDIRAVYQDKLQEMKLAGVSVHELVEAEFEIAATGPSNFSVDVSERLEKISKDQYMPNAIGKILGNAISNKEERRVLVNSITDTIRRNMISLYSTAEENKINIFSLSESYKCLENTFKEVYRLTANCGYDFTNHIIVAQKITDEFMKNWSPANKSYLAEEMHCSGFFVGSSDMLQGVIPEYNKSLHWNDIDQAIKKDADYSKQLTKNKDAYKKTINNLKRIVKNSLSSLTENSHIGSGLLLKFTQLFNYNVSAAGASQCRKEIADVFKEIDSNANGRSERFFSEMKFDLRKMYRDLNKYTNYDVTFKDVMTYMSKKTFELCYHQHLKDDNLTKEKRIELSQKLSNLILARYSLLAGTAKVSKDKYMDFVIRDENVLNDILENSERVNKANARAEEAKEMQKVAAKAQLELKRNYKRVIANPIPTDGKIQQPFIRACREELRQSFNDSRLTEAFKLQVVKVLNDFGVENVAATNAANAIFAKLSDKDEGMYKIYKALESYVEWPQDPKLFVDEMIIGTTKEYRKLVNDCFEDPAIGIIASRNVMDVILKNYSPAAFAKGDTLRNQVNSYLFESNSINGNSYFHNYFNDSNYIKDFPEGKIPLHNDRSDFIKWIKDANEKLEREAEAKRVAAARRERKPVEKYERKVEGIQLSLREGKDDDYILTDVAIDVFRDECKNSFADNNLTAYVKWQIGEILADSGVEYSKIQGTVDNIFTKCSGNNGVLSFYDKTSATSVLHDGMIYSDTTMRNIVQRSMKFISKATEECYSSFEEGFATNQRILDVILKNYSPVAFTQGKLDLYANGFLVKNDDPFGRYYQENVKNTGWYGINPVMNKVREIYANLGKKAPANESAIKDDKKPAPEKEQISVDLSKADASKVDAPKVDAPKVDEPKVEANESVKERIAVNEALDNVESAKVSNKVEEIKAPVSSKSKE